MANTAAPIGFLQTSGLGSVPTYEQVSGLSAYNASAIYFGDPVEIDSNGLIVRAAAGTDPIAGIFVGCRYLSVAMRRTVWNNFWPGSDVASGNQVEVYYINDPNAQFLVQSGSVGLTQEDVGELVQFNLGSPNTVTGISGAFVETPDTTATKPFRVVSIVTTPILGIAAPESGAYAWAIVAFNNVLTRVTTGV